MNACLHALVKFVPIWTYERMRGFCMEQLGNDFGHLAGFEGHIGQIAIRMVHHYLVDGWCLEETEEAGILLADQVTPVTTPGIEYATAI